MPNRRAQLSITAPGASDEEAVAVVAAIERFLRDHAPPLATAGPSVSPWVRAARLEAVGREPGAHPWLDD